MEEDNDEAEDTANVEADVEAEAEVDVDGVGVDNTEPAASDQRQHERFRVSLKVLIRLSDGEIARAHAVDLSKGGIYIEYGAPADAGKVFEIAFDLPFADDFRRVFAKARVVRTVVIGSRNLFGMAFVFTEFGKNSDEVLNKYIEHRGFRMG
ncbi:hypothetical protein MNBD_GAMMA09-3786 [hydrothermal vent metagenome]|uniref:PilZ domain-containing protein n=1 Tax=hydrothermal vent metagenome TaxID=652676 RepID=A0A3B0X4C7_9ZZZZ